MKAEGCYIFHERVKNKWVRNGKCTGRLINKRLEEHESHAKNQQDSDFYRSYPLGEIGHKGKYEWLDACIGLGCYPSQKKQLRCRFFEWKNNVLESSGRKIENKQG